MANKDRVGHSNKKTPAHGLKEKRAVKRAKKGPKAGRRQNQAA